MSDIKIDFFEHKLSGNLFSELKKVENLKNNDLFLLETLSNDQYQSKSISYNSLSSSIFTNWKDALDIKSMAYEETWKYAEKEHNHDGVYNKLSVEQYHISGQKTCVAIISSSNQPQELSVFAPVVVSMDPPEYEIGTIKFVYTNSPHSRFTNEDIMSDDFDGWVYADGTTFTIDERNKSRFKKALDEWGVTNSQFSFKIPCLSNFIKSSYKELPNLSVFPQQLGVAEHSHDIDQIEFDGELKLKKNFKFKTYENYGSPAKNYSRNIHNGINNSVNIGKVNFNFDLEQVQFDLSCNEYGSSNQKFEPRHNSIPIMIYIGGVKYN